ncbi:MAG: ABC transporter permease [Anaerolineae bacterium]
MSEQDIAPGKRPGKRIHRFLQNPVTMKELRSRMRGRRAFVVLTIYLLLMSGFISLVYGAYTSSAGNPFGPDQRQAGKVLFSAVLGIQVFMVIFIGPAFTAGAITGEKERQTFELLRTTLLTAKSFVAGKLISALSYVLLLIFAAVPLQSIAFLLGGVSLLELLLSQLLLVIAAVTFALYGLFCSSALRSTLSASVTTFAGSLFMTLGLPAIIGIFGAFIGPVLASSATLSWVSEALLVYGGLVLAATNLPATLIVSDIFLLENDALFFFKSSIGSRSAWLFSPWPLFIVLYLLMAAFFYWATVRRVRRIANK